MSKIVIKAENISKQYRLGEIGTGTISHDLNRWWYKVRGKEDPFLKIGESNDRSQKGESDFVWSLKDINFDINEGDIVGIIGRNGAGKSTLLKLLSKVTKPTTGQFKVKGRIASLLEVGTGFHPEMTGRENIYLNGAILGMRRAEIRRKFDEIVDFAGIERYIDTPVKRYSSGMYVRLAFAVAAHLESEILIVDEVLAVGDAEFQKKCLGKMNDVSKGEGRTVLFVSHNMDSISKLCENVMLLSKGTLEGIDQTNKAISSYLNQYSELNNGNLIVESFDSISNKINLLEVRVNNKENCEVHLNDDKKICIEYVLTTNFEINVIPFASVFSNTGELIFISSLLIDKANKTYSIDSNRRTNINHEISIPSLNSGEFYLSFGLADPGFERFVSFEKTVKLICQSPYLIGMNGYFSADSRIMVS